MASDQVITAKIILDSLMDIQHRGLDRALEDLEQTEPDLLAYLLENLTTIHHKILAAGVRAKAALRIHRQTELLAMVCITAVGKAHRRLWEGAVPEHPHDPLDPGPT
jgi:hypothetical protein